MKKRLALFLPLVTLWGSQVEQVELVGLHRISPSTALMKIKIHRGDPLDLEKIDESIRALYQMGYFQQIYGEVEGNRVIFRFVEKPSIAKVTFVNLSDELKKLMKEEGILVQKGQLYNPYAIQKMKNFIRSYYRAKGYTDTYVEIEKLPFKGNNQVIELKVIIQKGYKTKIRNVEIFGVKKGEAEDVIDELENKPRGFLSPLPFFNSGYLKLYELPKDWEKVRDYFLNRGYIDAQVSSPYAKVNRDSHFADIYYQVKEGIQYRVGKVKVVYPPQLKVKLPDLVLETGKFFNINAMREDIKNITHAFQNLGYAFPEVKPLIHKDKKRKVADVTYQVIPGNIYYIRKVYISGNQKTLDRVIRRYVYLLPGHKFTYRDLADSKRRLQRSGYFEKVDIKLEKVDNHLLDVYVQVKEGLSGNLVAGISYGSYNKLGFDFRLTERNIFGSGQTFKASASISAKSSAYNISLFNPNLLDSPYSLKAGIFSTKFEGISYTYSSRGFYFGMGRELTRNLSTSLTFRYSHNKLSDYDEELTYLLPDSYKHALIWNINYNDTDAFYFPTDGKILDLSIEYAGLGGDEKYIKTIATAKFFHPILNDYYEKIAVFKIKGVYGVIDDRGYLPINEKFYLGGYGRIRGFQWYTISPVDEKGNRIGGKKEFIISPGVSTPLSQKLHMWLTGFVDYGGVGEDKINIIRSSYGFSIDWITPIAPINFTWAWPLKYKSTDDLQRFEFNIGMTW